MAERFKAHAWKVCVPSQVPWVRIPLSPPIELIMKSDITVILTLYKTPKSKIETLKQYKKFKIIVFDQNSNGLIKKEIKKILQSNFKYYYSPKNIGLSKSSNFLLSKVKTKYCLFTQPDILIDERSINLLQKAIKINKNAIFVAPRHNKKIKYNKINNLPKYNIVKNLKAACMLCDVSKLKKIGFFDDDFFLYWEDVYLMRKINKSNYKMILVNNASAFHDDSKSSETNFKTDFIRNLNFMYGELLYDYKTNKLKVVKIIRKFFQNLIFFIFNIVIFQLKEALNNIAKITGTLKFIKFYVKKL